MTSKTPKYISESDDNFRNDVLKRILNLPHQPYDNPIILAYPQPLRAKSFLDVTALWLDWAWKAPTCFHVQSS